MDVTREICVLEWFNMKGAKLVSSPIGSQFKLTKKSCPFSKEKKMKMDVILYSSAVGSLMYAMVCTRLDIAHVVGVVRRFPSYPSKGHWKQ